MSDTSYTIEPDGRGGFQITVREPGADNGHIMTGFASQRQAQDWINDRLRHTMGGVSPKGWT